jgi:hypothetical protein
MRISSQKFYMYKKATMNNLPHQNFQIFFEVMKFKSNDFKMFINTFVMIMLMIMIF